MTNALLFLATALLSYCLPGIAALQWINYRRIGIGARILLAISLSIVIVPFAYCVIGYIVPVFPNAGFFLPLAALIGIVGFLLQRKRAFPEITIVPKNSGAPSIGRGEGIFVAAWILVWSCMANLPRLDTLVHGAAATVIGTADAFWHLPQMIAVSNSGIPPSHYLFSDVPLSYYYWVWILPASIHRLFSGSVPPDAIFTSCLLIQSAVFLGVAFYFLYLNTSNRMGRLFGLFGFSILGGLDIFAALGHYPADMEWWQAWVPWIRGEIQISSMSTLYLWVPQHLMGGLAFLLILLLIRNIRGSARIRIGLLGILLSYILGASAFVFLGAASALFLWQLCYLPRIRWKQAIGNTAVFIVCFMAGSWRQLLLMGGRPDSLSWGTFRVPLVEVLMGSGIDKFFLADRLFTFLFLPIILLVIFSIDLGLPFLVYVWRLVHPPLRRARWEWFLISFIALWLILVLVIKDNPGGNFSSRGFIPAEICILILACAQLARIWEKKGKTLASGLVITSSVCLLGLQILWPMEEIRLFSSPALGAAFNIDGEARIVGFLWARGQYWPESLRYIPWINVHTPTNSLVVESGLTDEPQDGRFLLLERMRYLDPKEADGFVCLECDLAHRDLVTLRKTFAENDMLSLIRLSPYVARVRPALFWVDRQKPCRTENELVYSDAHVCIYSLDTIKS
jgi:hypothetical protein